MKSGGDFVENESGGFIERGVGGAEAFEKKEELIEWDVPEFGEGFAEDFEVEGVGLEAGALAFWAFGVSAVACKEDANVHFVGFALEPVEKSLDAIPVAFVGDGFSLF